MTIEKLLEELKKQQSAMSLAINILEGIVASSNVTDAITLTGNGDEAKRKYRRKKPYVFTKARKENIKKMQKARWGKKSKFKMTPKRIAHMAHMREVLAQKKKAKIAAEALKSLESKLT
jgi:DNA polymerase III delta prime subunit